MIAAAEPVPWKFTRARVTSVPVAVSTALKIASRCATSAPPAPTETAGVFAQSTRTVTLSRVQVKLGAAHAPLFAARLGDPLLDASVGGVLTIAGDDEGAVVVEPRCNRGRQPGADRAGDDHEGDREDERGATLVPPDAGAEGAHGARTSISRDCVWPGHVAVSVTSRTADGEGHWLLLIFGGGVTLPLASPEKSTEYVEGPDVH